MVNTVNYSMYARRLFPIRCGSGKRISALHEDPWYSAEERLARVAGLFDKNGGNWRLRDESLIRWMQKQNNSTLIEAVNLYLDGQLADRKGTMEFNISAHAIDLTNPIRLREVQRKNPGFINQILVGREGAVLQDVCGGAVIAVVPCADTCGYDFFGYTLHHPKKQRESFSLNLLENAARWITDCVQ